MGEFLPSRRLLFGLVVAPLAGLAAGAPSRGAFGYRRTSGHARLARLCTDLHCPEAIRSACLRALPAGEAAPDRLATLILTDLAGAHRDCTSATGLRRAVRDRSRDDFSSGKIAIVDGWMLSRTETRLYALAGLLATEPDGAAPLPSS